MTKKDYTLIARCIRKVPPAIRDEVALEFVAALSAENPNFDAEKFYAATIVLNECVFTFDTAEPSA